MCTRNLSKCQSVLNINTRAESALDKLYNMSAPVSPSVNWVNDIYLKGITRIN